MYIKKLHYYQKVSKSNTAEHIRKLREEQTKYH